MSQTKEGAIKVLAKKAGIPLEEFIERTEVGLKWCYSCGVWNHRDKFGLDKTRYDGLTPKCRACRSKRFKEIYVPSPGPPKGRHFVEPREDDRKQARRRVNYLVEAGLIPSPGTLPCKDCGHADSGDGKRHEYDHYLGYSQEHHEDVEPLCSGCHHERENQRRKVQNG